MTVDANEMKVALRQIDELESRGDEVFFQHSLAALRALELKCERLQKRAADEDIDEDQRAALMSEVSGIFTLRAVFLDMCIRAEAAVLGVYMPEDGAKPVYVVDCGGDYKFVLDFIASDLHPVVNEKELPRKRHVCESGLNNTARYMCVRYMTDALRDIIIDRRASDE